MTATILVPHDLTDAADAALRTATALPYAGAPVVVLHVLPRIDLAYPGVVWSGQDDEPRRAHAREALARHAAAIAPHATLEVEIGDPSTRIVERARSLGARLVVMPTHARDRAERYVLGSVSQHVTRLAPCPVLLLPADHLGRAVSRASPPPGGTRAERMDALGTEICAQVDAHRGAFLTALRIGLPADEDREWWERALEQRLATSGIEFVDLVFAPAPEPTILDARFEQRWA